MLFSNYTAEYPSTPVMSFYFQLFLMANVMDVQTQQMQVQDRVY